MEASNGKLRSRRQEAGSHLMYLYLNDMKTCYYPAALTSTFRFTFFSTTDISTTTKVHCQCYLFCLIFPPLLVCALRLAFLNRCVFSLKHHCCCQKKVKGTGKRSNLTVTAALLPVKTASRAPSHTHFLLHTNPWQ